MAILVPKNFKILIIFNLELEDIFQLNKEFNAIVYGHLFLNSLY